jgi:hypothetical protein
MSQFKEPTSKEGKCPVCGKPVTVRSTRGKAAYCSRACASMPKYAMRYKGTNSGPMDRPRMSEKTKLPS